MSKSLTIYISNYNQIGGVERFVENFCKRMSKHYDITLIFNYIESNKLLFEMSDFVKVKKIDLNKLHETDYLIVSTQWGVPPYRYIKAKEKTINIIHAEYTQVIENWNFKYTQDKDVTHTVCVGKVVKDSFEIATPYKCDSIIYNLLDNTIKVDKKPKNDVLTLITVSRVSGEKGFDRMKKFAELLELKNIPYIWNVYGNVNNDYNKSVIKKFANTKVKFNGVIRNPFPEINKADYLVQLSDTEGFAYSVYEAMQVKTPCLITPFASGNEQITDGVNGYILPFDMENIDLDKIVNKIPIVPDFEEVGSEESWIEFLENGKRTNRKNN